MTEPRPAIQLEDVSYSYGTLQVLDRVSVRVDHGAVYGLLGVNGAGKTTILRLLLGLLRANAGTVSVLGDDVRNAPDATRRRCGALLEHTGLYERLSALENLEFFGALYDVPVAVIRRRAEELLSRFGVWTRRHEKVGTWSRGMKVRLAIARAMLHEPVLLTLDEPTAGLDPVAAQALRAELGPLLADTGCTVLLTTHNLAEAQRLCTHIGVLDRGRIVAQGQTSEIVARSATAVRITAVGATPAVAELLMRRSDTFDVQFRAGSISVTASRDSATQAVTAALTAAGATIVAVEPADATLESAFLSLLAS